MKDLKQKDLKPLTKGDQLLKYFLDEHTYSEDLDERNANAKEEYAQNN